MREKKVDGLQVSGANLYYEVRGSGPLLLLIHGATGDASGFENVADYLADRYTVVTYDRRGYTRSKLDNPTEMYRLQTHSDDAHRLLEALTTEPAFVFGSSAGALVGLDLVTRYANQVHTLIAHEAPAQELLSDAERVKNAQFEQALEETYHREGIIPVFRQFVAGLGVDIDTMSRPSDATLQEKKIRNIEYFVAHEAAGVRHYVLDMAALKSVSARIVSAAGSQSQSTFPYSCATELANRLSTEFVEFPGNHAGYVTHPQAFAEKLREVLND